MSHRDSGLGAKVLHDHFLDVAVALVQFADREQGIDAVFGRFADADQQSRGEWNSLLSGLFDRTQTLGRDFIGSVVVRRAGGEQGAVDGFEHQSHAGRDGGETRDPFGAEQAGIRMRQQAGLAQHQLAHGFQIMQRGFVAEMTQRVAHLGEEQFRLVAQAEESLGASQLFAGAGDRENFVRSHGMRAGISGIAAEGAVAAVIAAKIRQRQEDFSRIGDDAGLEVFFCGAGRGEQRGKIVVTAADQPAGPGRGDGRSRAVVRLVLLRTMRCAPGRPF